jgi:rubrerythrin
MRRVLIDCKKIEELASKIYQHLADDETYANEVRKVFQKLSDDERAHARHIDLVLQGNKKEVEASQMIAWEKISDAVTLAESFFLKVEREKLSEENALRLAVDMEQRFVKVHVQNALHFHNQKLAELFNQLGSEDEAHLNTLKKCLQWWHAERKNLSQGA